MASMRENPSTEDGVTEPELDTRTEPFQVVEVVIEVPRGSLPSSAAPADLWISSHRFRARSTTVPSTPTSVWTTTCWTRWCSGRAWRVARVFR